MTTLNFWKNSKPCEVVLYSSSVQVTYLKKSNKPVTVDISYVYLLAVLGDYHSGNNHHAVHLHFVRPVVNRRLRVDTLTLHSSDLDTCQLLVKALEDQLADTERPQKLAVIINPNSGKKQAEKVFYKKVQPLFKLCGIETKVVVTKAPKQARDVLQTLEMEDVDGIITVGGDGLYCEVLNGLILRTQKDHGVDVHDKDARMVPSRLPIGIIPAGTGDMVVQYLHGTRDVMTAAVRVLLGATLPANAVSVHQGEQLSAFSGLVLGFGLQGDMMADCERFRWMGHRRYNVIPIGTVLSRRSLDLEVEYVDEDTQQVTRTADAMYSVDTYVVSKREVGEHVQHVFGTDDMHVHMSSKCALGKHVQQLTKLKENTAGVFDYDFMTTARVESYTVRLTKAPTVLQEGRRVLKENYNINCDGEILRVTHPEYHVRLHRHAVRVFGETIV
ncbi:ceramide kinase-like [Babylonia areolata]|uniref:ceramide kinase-like n=1 Tax=Babylonia areolata TaxID=304850 RepID=UPI003FD45744